MKKLKFPPKKEKIKNFKTATQTYTYAEQKQDFPEVSAYLSFVNHFHTQCLLLKSCGMSQFSYDKYTQFPVKMEANYLVYCKYEGKTT